MGQIQPFSIQYDSGLEASTPKKLSFGLRRAGRRCRVTGISVQQPASRLKPWIVEAAVLALAGRVTGGPLVGDALQSLAFQLLGEYRPCYRIVA